MSVGPGSGYGYAAEAYMSGLRDAGTSITWTPLGWPSNVWNVPFGPVADAELDSALHRDIVYADITHDTVVAHSVPVWHDRLAVETSSKLLVVFTTWETDRIHDNWVPILNRYERVLVPSQFNAGVFSDSGVTAPISVVPHIARSVQAPPMEIPRTSEQRRFRFYVIATWTTRKAILDLVAAFLGAFTSADEVTLVIHTTPTDLVALARHGGVGERRDTATWFTLAGALAGHTDVPDIVLSTRALDQAELDELHAGSDCFISLSRGEGWGLGAFDAGAHGNPVIVTGWSGERDFLPVDYPYLVEYDLVPTTMDEPDAWWQPRDGERWAKARIPHASALLRSVFDHPDEARSWGQSLQAHIQENFSSERVTGRLLDALDLGPTGPPVSFPNG